jgi:poly [ADP-ribose] polymerase
MANVVEEIRLILVEAVSNNNKWWTGRLYDNGDAETLWGRVGYSGDSKMFPGVGRSFLEKKQREKEKKGYTPLKTVGGPASVTSAQTKDVGDHERRQIAKAQLVKSNNPQWDRLIDRLVQANVHRITSSTQIQFNSSTGLFSTPLGIVTPDGISEARNLLVTLNQFVSRNDWTSTPMLRATSDYLRLVPQAVGMKLNVERLFPDTTAIQKQSDVLDSLEASYQALQTQTPQSPDATRDGRVEQAGRAAESHRFDHPRLFLQRIHVDG